MNTRKDRLNEVYEHLRSCFGIHTKTQFASMLKVTQPALSAAMNGNESYLTDNLFKKICAAYQGVFNLDYLLTGEGQLLATKNEDASDHLPQPTLPPSYDLSFMIEKAVDKATAYADQTINELRTRIAEKDEYIQTLKARIRDLESQLAPTKLPELNDYHFTMGAAESEKRL